MILISLIASVFAATIGYEVAELALLQAARYPTPYILASHSFGGLLIRAYAHLRPQEVAGLVFVDAILLEHWSQCRSKLPRPPLGHREHRPVAPA